MNGGSEALGGVSRETTERLEHLADLVRKWTPRINLVSKNSLDAIWQRHILDSAQVFALAPKGVKHWVDLGSGGGFPGLVVATLAKDLVQESAFTLIESDQRKAVFLRTAIRELDLSAKVITTRIETTSPQSADVVSARALSDLATLLSYFQRHAGPLATGLFMKGRTWKKEVEDARHQWSFLVEPIRSTTETEAVVLKIKEVARV